MFGGARGTADQAAKLDALDRSQAVIEFQPDGTILAANANFLTAMGYTLPEVRGQQHADDRLEADDGVFETAPGSLV